MRKLSDFELAVIRSSETRRAEARVLKKKKQRPIYHGEKRQHVVTRVIDRLRDWRFSPFEFEGACVQGLRSGLCLEGHGWLSANAEAHSVVAEALYFLGAKRPSWTEGQPEYTETREYCAWCLKPIETDNRLFGSQRHCSVECARAAALAVDNRDTRGGVYRAALRLVTAAAAPSKRCEYCGGSFQSDREEARFCSPACVSRWQKGENLRVDITCEVCGIVTKPRKKNSTTCSHACAGILRARNEILALAGERRVCPHCGDEFTPGQRRQLICGRLQCARAAKRASYHHNRRVAEHHLKCRWCGSVFASTYSTAKFCGSPCRKAIEALQRPTARPRPISPPVFDYVFRMVA